MQYFKDKNVSFKQRKGNFSRRDKNKFFRSQKTYEGLLKLQSVQLLEGSFFFNIKSDNFIQIFFSL